MAETERVTTREFYEKLQEVEQRIMDRLDVMNKDILQLQISKALLEGKADQRSVTWACLISIVGVIIAVISLLSV